MNCACKEWHRNGNRFRCYFGIKQGCRPAKIFANATAPFILEKLSVHKYQKLSLMWNNYFGYARGVIIYKGCIQWGKM